MRMVTFDRDYQKFKRAVILSVFVHLMLFLLIILSPYLPKSSRQPMIHYVNVVSLPGGGGGGKPGGGSPGGVEKVAETAIPERETLRDLTTPQKLEDVPSSSLRHPVEKPKKEPIPKTEKKAVIQKSEKTSLSQGSKEEAEGGGAGSGVRFGFGSGSGTGFQSPYSSQIGLSTFPFTYYLQIIIDRVSGNWFTSLVDPGTRGNFQTTVYFRILRDGRVSSLKIEESSGLRSLDLSALRAVQSSSPFPPLPKEYEEEYLGIHLIFEHSK